MQWHCCEDSANCIMYEMLLVWFAVNLAYTELWLECVLMNSVVLLTVLMI